MTKSPQNNQLRITFAIAFMIALRMYGLFLILPVFSVYAQDISGSTPFLMGLAIGVYGLTQAFLQIPMGFLSDIWGRKNVIALGLSLFLIGSVIAALATDITTIIIGRAVQGMGAIAATGMALIADVSKPEQRSKMMAIVGVGIGFSFMLAFITGPLLASMYGLSGLFWMTAILAGMALVVLVFMVHEPEKRIERDYRFIEVLQSIREKQLLLLDMGVFAIHASMSALFLVLPVVLVNYFDWPVTNHWQLYLPVMVASLFIMIPLIFWQEKRKNHVRLMLLTFLLLAINFLLLQLGLKTWLVIVLSLTVYFGLFNYLEASMPALLSKIATEKYRGAAMGAYSTAQFMGAFVGGAVGGYLMSYSVNLVLLALFALLLFLALVGFVVFGGQRSVS
ncbi:MFS transporter [Marinicella gelatinilytica]|uniref:MFS transporter n=1 Tax=Marinicella gelatinilytica TaxID=2996017 RepID=UPI002260D21C|nr:MFS transporter [Marinicella gelatinilytica]MCX7544572.1 MFS transporter [Marinicella gelatinilytica]